MNEGIIAVHCGAGFHGDDLHESYKKLCKSACRAAVRVLKAGGNALDACKAAVIVLEDNPLSNAGFGSNLTREGFVECDASVMDGKSLLYGGCAAIRNVKNPISLAYNICLKQSEPLPLGLIPPSLLVGDGGLQYAKSVNLPIVSAEELVSPKAMSQYRKYKRMLKRSLADDSKLIQNGIEALRRKMDTVGAVCLDRFGHVASACSSGGLSLKHPGRVGQAALYGSGVWADSFEPQEEEANVAVCTTGCGEHLMQTQLAREISRDLKKCTCPISGLSASMTENFIKSRFLRNVRKKNGGALVLHLSKDEGALMWGHSTLTMAIGYMQCTDRKPKSVISKLPENVPDGNKINVGGINFIFRRTEEDPAKCLQSNCQP